MLKRLEISGFKSFARNTVLDFSSNVTAVVGPNGSGKSNVAEAFRFALGEQSMKSMRGKRSSDLIFNGSHSVSRTNRAAVLIVFDNTKRVFKIDFDEVTVERVVFRDGASEYSINGSKVRLKDVHELLAGANMGDKGNHIISQGEADRILLAGSRDRRDMIEDALGLKIYEFKRQEAQNKLIKTEENISKVEAVRRELAPHLRFLSKQIEKINKAKELKDELVEASKEYFAIEDIYLSTEKSKAIFSKNKSFELFEKASSELIEIDSRLNKDGEIEKLAKKVRVAEQGLEKAIGEHAAISKEIGRVEGELSFARGRHTAVEHDPYVKVSRVDLTAFGDEIKNQTSNVKGELSAAMAVLSAIRKIADSFFKKFETRNEDDFLIEEEQLSRTLENKKQKLVSDESKLAEIVEKNKNVLSRAREDVSVYEETGREGQRRLVDLAQTKARENAAVAREESRLSEIQILSTECEREKGEMLALAGTGSMSYKPLTEMPNEGRALQEDRRRKLERLKIRLEESGGTGEDVRKEYEDAVAREEFLSRELNDLTQSAERLRLLIKDLSDELSRSFTKGLAQVNDSFEKFFALMFGGGGARLVIESSDDKYFVDGDNETSLPQNPGIDVSVHLPKKRVQSLMQLSGGERALTSIALIFAMSQVNPPPFLILDETDAALDEANSRRYGDMIESLAKHSQLIVITHNRETMSRAGVLYGVTMGGNGVSKLLSVKFDDAVKVAK